MVLSILIAAITCYLLGNHNGAICVSAILGDDVRNHGKHSGQGRRDWQEPPVCSRKHRCSRR